ncbi:hypothetical protein SAMN05444278_101344 [Psychroflexus salarius]|jgi:FtsZ-interacting cell division protein ZipA|uniref:Uncharacterized protein n=1 Tax=Psychroflexus salarius TaxID=1155689 RepID=A0A1M4SVP4_9FLAO|nr:hypothetical protein SAMN05444278_101344 [Psychroflexus salarius]
MLSTILIILGTLLLINLLLLIFSSNSKSKKSTKTKIKLNGPKSLAKSKKTKYVLYADK